MAIKIDEFSIDDYDAVYSLWRESEGLGLSDADSREGIDKFLQRNPGLSFVARDDQEIVGALLCGHDGRRGYIHHLAVRPSHRKQGIGKSLVSRTFYELMRIGIRKCHLFVFGDNQGAIQFWKKTGWSKRVELVMMSHFTED
jgi:putative acetyltransferase